MAEKKATFTYGDGKKAVITIEPQVDANVVMLKGDDGMTSYELAVKYLGFTGTLEDWIKAYTTPEDYFTRDDLKMVTQAEYDDLKANNKLVAGCYYFITDDTIAEDFEKAIATAQGTADQALELSRSNKTDIGKLDQKIKTATIETSVSWTSSDTSIHTSSHSDSGFTSAKVSVPYGAQIKSITISDVESSAEKATDSSMSVVTINASDAIMSNFMHELTISVRALETISKGAHGTISGTLALTYLYLKD